LRTLRAAGIISYCGNLFRALGCQFIEPINDLGIAAALIDETRETIATIAPTWTASHAQDVELADQITEYDCTFAGH